MFSIVGIDGAGFGMFSSVCFHDAAFVFNFENFFSFGSLGSLESRGSWVVGITGLGFSFGSLASLVSLESRRSISVVGMKGLWLRLRRDL